MTELLAWFVTVAGVLGAVAAFVKYVIKPFRVWTKKIRQFFADWFGEEGRPGVERRPGVMEELADQKKRLQNVERHVGNGSSIPLHQKLDQHMTWADQQSRILNNVVRHVGLQEE